MEPTVEKLSADIEKIREDHEELRKKLPTIVETLSSVQQQVRTHEWYFSLVRPAGYVLGGFVAAFVVFLGFKGVPDLRDHIVNSVKTEVKGIVKRQIDKVNVDVSNRMKLFEDNINQATDRLIFTNAEFLAVIDDVKSKKRPPGALSQLDKERVRSDGLFAVYTDALLSCGFYDDSYHFLCELQNKGRFPGHFNWPDSFANAGFIEWINALSTDPTPEPQIKQAREWLHKAERLAKQRIAATELRRPLELLVLFYLTQNKHDEAIYYAREVRKAEGKKSDFDKYIKASWFARLKKKRPEIQQSLEGVLSVVFQDEIPESRSP